MREHNYYVPEKPARRRKKRHRTSGGKAAWIAVAVLLLLIAAAMTVLFLTKTKTRTVTLPLSFFEGQTFEEVQSASEGNKEIKSCVLDEDGNVVYSMTQRGYRDLLTTTMQTAEKTFENMVNGEERVESFVSIRRNEDLSKIDVYVNPDTYTEWDSLSALAFYTIGGMYQKILGIPGEEIDVKVNFINNLNQEILNSASLRDMMSDQ